MTLSRVAAALSSVSGPVLLVLAGSNGAGKTTFHRRYLSRLGWPFVNADEIAKALGRPIDDSVSAEAAALADRIRLDLIAGRRSFIAETVFSDPVGARLAQFSDARARGFHVVLLFIGLDSVEVSTARVLQRVRYDRGHDVPDDRLRSRFPRTLANLSRAMRLVDTLFVLDNTSPTEPFREVACWRSGKPEWEAGRLPEWYVTAKARFRDGDPSGAQT